MRVVAFAQLREMLGGSERTVQIAHGERVADVWAVLARSAPSIDELRVATRSVKNGRVVAFDEPVADGDEVAFLPPVGGG